MRPSSRPDTTDLRLPQSIRDAVGALLRARRIPASARPRPAAVGRPRAAGPLPAPPVPATAAARLPPAEGSGEPVLRPPQAARPDTAWLWFSMSKLVTATAVMRLAEHGLLDLDAPFR